MGKRSDFDREERDYYRTFDPRAAAALSSHLGRPVSYIEPCAGAGDLVRSLGPWGHKCVGSCDIEPGAPWIQRGDAMRLSRVPFGVKIITNPPWRRDLLHPMIERFSRLADTWLLFDADWMHTRQASPLLAHCREIISVGRLRWIPGTTTDGKDNCCWYHFDAAHRGGPRFIARRLDAPATAPATQPRGKSIREDGGG